MLFNGCWFGDIVRFDWISYTVFTGDIILLTLCGREQDWLCIILWVR